ncbi:hypothetical protein AAHA92_03248 [Salvia divinorum]|uniref:Uncharacterized protein n=1 Tax=Salvia divinorum TaxID=28513 RepID=A0ABD1IHJ4_SALDI
MKEAEEDTTFQEDEVEVHEISDDVQFIDPPHRDPSGAMIPILREVVDDDDEEEEEEEEDDDDDDDDEYILQFSCYQPRSALSCSATSHEQFSPAPPPTSSQVLKYLRTGSTTPANPGQSHQSQQVGYQKCLEEDLQHEDTKPHPLLALN